jgi:hypothetical protein
LCGTTALFESSPHLRNIGLTAAPWQGRALQSWRSVRAAAPAIPVICINSSHEVRQTTASSSPAGARSVSSATIRRPRCSDMQTQLIVFKYINYTPRTRGLRGPPRAVHLLHRSPHRLRQPTFPQPLDGTAGGGWEPSHGRETGGSGSPRRLSRRPFPALHDLPQRSAARPRGDWTAERIEYMLILGRDGYDPDKL